MTIPPGEQTINPLPAAQSDFLEVLDDFLQKEDAERQAFTWSGWVVSGGVHGVQAGLTATPSPLTAFPGGYYITETASITYTDNVTTWVICAKDTVGDLGPFLRVPGTHYLTQELVGSPTLPAGTVLLMQVVTLAGSIVLVNDYRILFPEFKPGVAPHIRLTGTEASAKDFMFGESFGKLVLQENIATFDVPSWTNRLEWIFAALSHAIFDFSVLTAFRTYTWPDKSGTVAMISDIAAGLFDPGTRMIFDQDSAPTGWTRDVSATIDDRVIRLVSGLRVNVGSWTITGLSVSPHVHDLGAHKHDVPVGGASGGGIGGAGFLTIASAWPHGSSGNIYLMSDTAWNGADAVFGSFNSGPSTGNTGSTQPPVASDGTWRPLSRDMIVCTKN